MYVINRCVNIFGRFGFLKVNQYIKENTNDFQCSGFNEKKDR